jgi:hypothetical protein
MNFRHAALLALVGWYLMVPPQETRQAWNWHLSNPSFSQWNMVDLFDRAKECKEVRNKMRDDAQAETDAELTKWLAGRKKSISLAAPGPIQ